MFKKLWLGLRLLIVLFIWGLGGYVLCKYEFLANFGKIDNIVGMLPFALVLVGAFGAAALLFIKHSRRWAPVSVVLTFFVLLSVVLFPTALRGAWWISPAFSSQSEIGPDLSVYAPFSENSKTAKLGEAAELQLMSDLPRLDGATALYPVYAAFAEAVYDEGVFSAEDVLCTNTRNAYEALIAGERDIIFVASASAQQRAAAEAAGADLRFIPIGHEALVFLVGSENPIDSITYQQIRNIYSGKTASWGTLGWREGGRIIAFQRPEGSGSQTGLQWIMGTLPIQAPQPLPDASILGTNSLMKQISVEWQGVQPAIGYSYRYYATTMYANPDAKILSIDGIAPSTENIQNKSYPFAADFYAVTNGEPVGNVKLFIEWILSAQGQELIEKTGYVKLEAVG